MSSTIVSRRRRMWTHEEDDVLRRTTQAQATASNGFVKDWCSISKMLPGRTNKDCRKRWSKVTKGVNKGTWAPDEDERLIRAMETFGPSWQLIAEKVGTRHAEQCAKRYQHSLDPHIDRSEWTEGDDKALMDAVAIEGRSWRRICKTYFPRRSTTDIKNHFEYVSRRKKHPTDNAFGLSPNDTLPNPDVEYPLSDSSSDFAEENNISSCSTRYTSSVPREHILTGSHPAPSVVPDFSPDSSVGGTPGGYRSDDMISFNANNVENFQHMQTFGHNLPLNTLYTTPTTLDSTLGTSPDTRSPHNGHMTQFTPMDSRFTNFTPNNIGSWNQQSNQFGTSSPFDTYPIHAIRPAGNESALLHDHSSSNSGSPGCTLILKEIQPQNVGMVLDPLVRSGVHVKMQLYNGR